MKEDVCSLKLLNDPETQLSYKPNHASLAYSNMCSVFSSPLMQDIITLHFMVNHILFIGILYLDIWYCQAQPLLKFKLSRLIFIFYPLPLLHLNLD